MRAAPRRSAPRRLLTPPRRCARWCLYGCLRGDYYVFFSNSQGVVLGVWFTLSTLPLMDAKARSLPLPYSRYAVPPYSRLVTPHARRGGA